MTLSNDDDDEVSYMALTRGTPVASCERQPVRHGRARACRYPSWTCSTGSSSRSTWATASSTGTRSTRSGGRRCAPFSATKRRPTFPSRPGRRSRSRRARRTWGPAWNHPFGRMFGREHWVEKRD